MIALRIVLALFGVIMLGGCGVFIYERVKKWKQNTILYDIAHIGLIVALFTMGMMCFYFVFS